MGLLRPCLSTSGPSIEIAVLELYDEATARAAPGFDDVTGQPFLPDSNDDGLGERTRPGVTVELKCKTRAARFDEQVQDQTGNTPESLVILTLYEYDLKAAGLIVNGVCSLRPNDRLLRLKSNTDGTTRVEFTNNGREGLHCFEVRPGETGEGLYTAFFERRRKAAQG